MKIKFVSIFFAFFVLIEAREISESDPTMICMMNYLGSKQKLDPDFPSSGTYVMDANCTRDMEILKEAYKERFRVEIPGVKTACVVQELEKGGVFDDMMLQAVISMNITDYRKRVNKIQVVEDKIDKGFEAAAKKCDSDVTYGGAYSDFLGVDYVAVAVAEEKYCVLKHLNDVTFFENGYFDPNPDKIDVKNVFCDEIMETLKKEDNERARMEMEKARNDPETIACVMKLREEHQQLDVSLAKFAYDRVVPLHEDVNLKVIETKTKEFAAIAAVCKVKA